MKGLLKNNFYAVWSSAKIFAIFMLLLGAFVTLVVSQQLLLFYMLLGITGFSINAVAGMGKDYISKWGKYKLTSPVKRADIVKSYFINELIWLLVGVVFAGIGMGLSWLLHGCPFDRSIDALMMFAMGIGISLFAAAIFFPLFYLGGEKRRLFSDQPAMCGWDCHGDYHHDQSYVWCRDVELADNTGDFAYAGLRFIGLCFLLSCNSHCL